MHYTCLTNEKISSILVHHRLQIDANTAGVYIKEENARLTEKHAQNAIN